MSQARAEVAYAGCERLEKTFWDALRPRERLTVSEWADRYRVLVSESSAASGRWRTSATPYQREIMDAFTQRDVERIVVMCSAQVGKTEIMLNMMMRAIDIDPGPMAYLNSTALFSDDFSKRRFMPAVSACERIAGLMADSKSRDSGNTITLKTFPGGSVAFIGANSPTELASRPIRYIFGDEIDRWPESAGAEGDPLKLIEKRATTFRNRRIVYVSTPTTKKNKINQQYLLGTQEEWQVKCPECGRLHMIRFEDIRYKYDAREVNGRRQYHVYDVFWKCPDCLGEFGETVMKAAPAEWVAHNAPALEQSKCRSFHLNAFTSHWVDWRAIITEYLEAEKDVNLLRVFYNTTLGEPWDIMDVDDLPDELLARREHYAAEIPNGCLVLTMGVDTQDNRMQYEIVGWGEDEESWGIQYGMIPGRADTPQPWLTIDDLLRSRWKRQDGREMRIACTFVDSGGHFTSDVYRQCAKRTQWRVFAIKGVTGDDREYVKMSKLPGQILFLIGVDSGKAAIMANAQVREWGPNYMHFNDDEQKGYGQDYFKSLISEKMELHTFRGRQRMGWHKIYDRNEALDCRNYARAAFKGFDWRLQELKKRYAVSLPTPQTQDVRTVHPIRPARSPYISRGIKV